MAVSDWSTNPDLNGLADPSVPAVDSAPARKYVGLIRQIMASVAQFSKSVPAVGYKPVYGSYQALVTDTHVAVQVINLPTTIYFPNVDDYPLGVDFIVSDESNMCSVDLPINLAPGPGTNDQIAEGVPLALTNKRQSLRFRRTFLANLWVLS